MSKYKLKSSRAIAKRFKVTASGKCLRRRACRSHLLEKKSSKQKQQLRKVFVMKRIDCSLLKSQMFSLI